MRHSGRTRLNGQAAFAVFCALPGLHCWWLHGFKCSDDLLVSFGALIASSGVGSGIYATHIFDRAIGNELGLPDVSHHVMHVMVLTGAFIFERGLLSAYQN